MYSSRTLKETSHTVNKSIKCFGTLLHSKSNVNPELYLCTLINIKRLSSVFSVAFEKYSEQNENFTGRLHFNINFVLFFIEFNDQSECVLLNITTTTYSHDT